MPDSNPVLWFNAPGRVEVRTAAVPAPARGEVLIRSQHTLISTGSELSLFTDRSRPGSAWREFAQFPRQVGYCNAGEVIKVGEGVDDCWVNKRVATRGRHAAWITWPVEDLRPLPDTVATEDATFATLAGVVMNGLRRVGLTYGESVAIFGLGIIGQLAARFAAIAGAGPILGIELSQLRSSKLPRQPLMHVVDGEGDLLDCVRRHNQGRSVEVVVEATGQAKLIPKEIELLRDQGRLLLLSSPREATNFDFHDLCNRPSISIVGAHGFSQPAVATPDNPWTSKRHGDLFLLWLAAGRLTVNELITHRFPIDRAAEAYALLADRRNDALGVIFDWT